MRPTNRRPRPLTREEVTYRDDRLFIIATDDTAGPKQYFDFFRLNRIQIHVIPTEDGTSSAEHVLGRLCEVEHEPDDERWLLLDTDHYIYGRHAASYTRALQIAQQKGISIALSRPCFELWLLLHHDVETNVVEQGDARQVSAQLKGCIGTFNKVKLLRENFPDALLAQACLRASRLDKNTPGGLIPASATTRVYKLWRNVLDSVPHHALSEELRELKNDVGWSI